MPPSQAEAIYCLARLHASDAAMLDIVLKRIAAEGCSPLEYLSRPRIARLVPAAQWIIWREESLSLSASGIQWHWPGCPEFPIRLLNRCLEHPWPLLFFAGAMSLMQRPAIGIVGTRQPSAAATRAVHALAGELAVRGVCVISGNAAGIDSAAHRGALAADSGKTIRVLPLDLPRALANGPDSMSKGIAQNRDLWLSPWMPGEAIHRGHFIKRNELIAAMSDILVAGEVGARSGAFHAIKTARRLGLPVYVLCNKQGRPYGEGGAGLLKSGARPLVMAAAKLDDMAYQAGSIFSMESTLNSSRQLSKESAQSELFHASDQVT